MRNSCTYDAIGGVTAVLVWANAIREVDIFRAKGAIFKAKRTKTQSRRATWKQREGKERERNEKRERERVGKPESQRKEEEKEERSQSQRRERRISKWGQQRMIKVKRRQHHAQCIETKVEILYTVY